MTSMTRFDYEKMKPILIEYFVRIRGEANRDAITRRINQSELVFIYDANDLVAKYNHSISNKKIELTIKFLELNGINVPDDIKIQALAYNQFLGLKQLPGANKIIEIYFNGEAYDYVSFNGFRNLFMEEHEENEMSLRKRVEILKKMGASVDIDTYDEFINSKEATPFLMEIERQKRIIGVLDKEFNEFINSEDLLRDKERADKVQTAKDNIYEKNLLLFIESIKQYLSDSDRKKIDDFITSGSPYITSLICLLDSYNILFRSNIDKPGCIEAFNSESIDKLNDPNTKAYDKSEIISNQIKYFRQMGLYDGSIPFEEFLKTEIARNNIPNQSFADHICNQRKKFKEKAEDDFFKTTSSYSENIEQLSKMGLSIDPQYEDKFIKKGTHFITPCQRVVNGKNDICSIIYFRELDVHCNFRDIDFIHEVGHVIETSLINENGIDIYKCGFELIPVIDEGERETESFNEVINQLFSMEVAEAMHEDGIFLFDDPRFSKVRGTSSYEHNIRITNYFYEKYRNTIGDSRISESLNELYKRIGKNNFNTLNSLENKFSTLPIGKDFCKSEEEESQVESRKTLLVDEFNSIIESIEENQLIV